MLVLLPCGRSHAENFSLTGNHLVTGATTTTSSATASSSGAGMSLASLLSSPFVCSDPAPLRAEPCANPPLTPVTTATGSNSTTSGAGSSISGATGAIGSACAPVLFLSADLRAKPCRNFLLDPAVVICSDLSASARSSMPQSSSIAGARTGISLRSLPPAVLAFESLDDMAVEEFKEQQQVSGQMVVPVQAQPAVHSSASAAVSNGIAGFDFSKHLAQLEARLDKELQQLRQGQAQWQHEQSASLLQLQQSPVPLSSGVTQSQRDGAVKAKLAELAINSAAYMDAQITKLHHIMTSQMSAMRLAIDAAQSVRSVPMVSNALHAPVSYASIAGVGSGGIGSAAAGGNAGSGVRSTMGKLKAPVVPMQSDGRAELTVFVTGKICNGVAAKGRKLTVTNLSNYVSYVSRCARAADSSVDCYGICPQGTTAVFGATRKSAAEQVCTVSFTFPSVAVLQRHMHVLDAARVSYTLPRLVFAHAVLATLPVNMSQAELDDSLAAVTGSNAGISTQLRFDSGGIFRRDATVLCPMKSLGLLRMAIEHYGWHLLAWQSPTDRVCTNCWQCRNSDGKFIGSTHTASTCKSPAMCPDCTTLCGTGIHPVKGGACPDRGKRPCMLCSKEGHHTRACRQYMRDTLVPWKWGKSVPVPVASAGAVLVLVLVSVVQMVVLVVVQSCQLCQSFFLVTLLGRQSPHFAAAAAASAAAAPVARRCSGCASDRWCCFRCHHVCYKSFGCFPSHSESAQSAFSSQSACQHSNGLCCAAQH